MFYKKHLFFCTNQREKGTCCANADSKAMHDYVKQRLMQEGLHGPGKIRISESGCMGRCMQGPSLVVYPDNVWYSYSSQSDLDEILHKHILGGEVVTRLLMPSERQNA